MASRTTKWILGLGLLAGSLAIAPTTQAQVQVTGGSTTGQAAFFIPGTNPEGAVRLFDLNLNTLRLVTPNGVTTTSVFSPSAANFRDVDNNGRPNRGDTGTLQGTLSGVVFTEIGTPVLFSGRSTALNFTLNRFNDTIGTIDGTLIRSITPGAAPLVFLPGVDSEALELTSPDFVDIGGELELGDFAARIDNGVIDLPSTLSFRESSTPVVLPFNSFVRRIRFEFQGEDVLPGAATDYDISDGAIRFVGAVNEKFEIRSVGTQGDREFRIEGEIGAVDMTIGGPFERYEQRGEIDPLAPLDDYKIRGESEGLFAFYGAGNYGFSSLFDSNTRFEFRQGENRVEGRSDGPVNFYAAVGLGGTSGGGDDDDDDDFDDFDGFDFGDDDFDDFAGDDDDINITIINTCTLCGNNLVVGRPINVGRTVITVGNPVVVDIPDVVVVRRTNRSVTTNVRSLVVYDSVNLVSSDLFTLVGSTNTALFQYGYVTGYRYTLLGDDLYEGNVFVRVIERGGDRYYVVTRGSGSTINVNTRVLVAYSQLGPGSRIFPGLGGLRELDPDEIDDLFDDDDISLDPDYSDDDDDFDDDLDDELDDDLDDDDDESDDESEDDESDDDESDDDESEDDESEDDGSDDESEDDESDDNDSTTIDGELEGLNELPDDTTTEETIIIEETTIEETTEDGTGLEGLNEI